MSSHPSLGRHDNITSRPPTYYEILNISPSTLLSSGEDPATLIKRAYRRALLRHHPDKKSTTTVVNTTAGITVDQISLAYATLVSPAQRKAYDVSLLTARNEANSYSSSNNNNNNNNSSAGEDSSFQTGIETIDLDDIKHDPTTDTWFRSCRCGNPRGYHFSEADLEEAADSGIPELMVGCTDCSLWLRVHFAVVEDDDDGKNGNEDGRGQVADDEAGGGPPER